MVIGEDNLNSSASTPTS
uniref:Uncharacterized protein n=1 Tax=Arundo donax TaxID=35708 RepID=A0A0A8ZX54_ARUDO